MMLKLTALARVFMHVDYQIRSTSMMFFMSKKCVSIPGTYICIRCHVVRQF